MDELKGQFMLVSAVIVSMILMTTATTMSEIKEKDYSDLDQAYDIKMIQELGNKMDLAKKSDRQKFRNAVDNVPTYSAQMAYNTRKRCYNITLSQTSSELNLNCVGNGSVFNDGFEDGEYRDPTWLKTTEYGQASINTIYAPNSGNKALKLSEQRDPSYSLFKMMWQRRTDVWDKEWKASGLFYTGELTSSSYQRQNVVLYYNESRSDVLKASIGFTDSSGDVQFKILDQGIIDNTDYGTDVNWQQDAWYHWEISHDGSGNYDGKIWREGQTKPSTPSTEASGAIPTDTGVGGLEIDGRGGSPFTVSHAFYKLRKR